jgi:hypothetical protein
VLAASIIRAMNSYFVSNLKETGEITDYFYYCGNYSLFPIETIEILFL